jgi:hypothetical protein
MIISLGSVMMPKKYVKRNMTDDKWDGGKFLWKEMNRSTLKPKLRKDDFPFFNFTKLNNFLKKLLKRILPR